MATWQILYAAIYFYGNAAMLIAGITAFWQSGSVTTLKTVTLGDRRRKGNGARRRWARLQCQRRTASPPQQIKVLPHCWQSPVQKSG
jgi:hypothetical protein